MALRVCPNCGKKYSEHIDVCPECGMAYSEAQLAKKERTSRKNSIAKKLIPAISLFLAIAAYFFTSTPTGRMILLGEPFAVDDYADIEDYYGYWEGKSGSEKIRVYISEESMLMQKISSDGIDATRFRTRNEDSGVLYLTELRYETRYGNSEDFGLMSIDRRHTRLYLGLFSREYCVLRLQKGNVPDDVIAAVNERVYKTNPAPEEFYGHWKSSTLDENETELYITDKYVQRFYDYETQSKIEFGLAYLVRGKTVRDMRKEGWQINDGYIFVVCDDEYAYAYYVLSRDGDCLMEYDDTWDITGKQFYKVTP